MKRHLREKHQSIYRLINFDEADRQQSSSEEQFKSTLVDCVVHAHLPFNIVENTYFRNLLRCVELSPDSNHILSARQIRDAIQDKATKLRLEIVSELQNQVIAITADGWSSGLKNNLLYKVIYIVF